jgi:ribonuclease D
MIANDQDLIAFLPELDSAPWIAVDTEADSLHSYPEKLCLLQISIPGQDVLVDPLSGIDMAPLWAVLQPRELMLHGCDYDLRLFSKHHGFIPDRIFDTMIAARLLGFRQFGLSNLVKDLLGLELEKGPQKSDWSKRPLTPRMEEYARNDTKCLNAMVEILRSRLDETGRLSWCEESCARMIQDNSHVEPPDPDRVWRIKKSSKLSRRAMAVLREIWQWRETEAVGSNRPPFFILRHESVLDIAHGAAEGEDYRRHIPVRFSQRRKRTLLEAIRRGIECPAENLPRPLRGVAYHPTEAEKVRYQRLREHRDKVAEKLGIEPTLIASKETLELLTRSENEAAWAGLMNWQRELLGGA